MTKAMTPSEWEKEYGMKWGSTTKSPKLEAMEKTIAALTAERDQQAARIKELEAILNSIISIPALSDIEKQNEKLRTGGYNMINDAIAILDKRKASK